MKQTYTVNVYQRGAFFDEHSGFTYPVAIECYRHYVKKYKDDPAVTVDLVDDLTAEVIESTDLEV